VSKLSDGFPNFFSSIFCTAKPYFDHFLRNFADPHHFLHVDPDFPYEVEPEADPTFHGKKFIIA
jgi:hypothetical protein